MVTLRRDAARVRCPNTDEAAPNTFRRTEIGVRGRRPEMLGCAMGAQWASKVLALPDMHTYL
jgi:hypothetical protein